MNAAQTKTQASTVKWLRVYNVARARLAGLRTKQFPQGSRVAVNRPGQYEGPAIVAPMQPDNPGLLEVINPNENRRQYPIECCTPTHTGQHYFADSLDRCEKCGVSTRYRTKVVDRWAPWCGCGNG